MPTLHQYRSDEWSSLVRNGQGDKVTRGKNEVYRLLRLFLLVTGERLKKLGNLLWGICRWQRGIRVVTRLLATREPELPPGDWRFPNFSIAKCVPPAPCPQVLPLRRNPLTEPYWAKPYVQMTLVPWTTNRKIYESFRVAIFWFHSRINVKQVRGIATPDI